jgi:hypothetical protein
MKKMCDLEPDTNIFTHAKKEFLMLAFSEESSIAKQIEQEISEMQSIIEDWQSQRTTQVISFSCMKDKEQSNIEQFLSSCGIHTIGDKLDLNRLPSARLLGYIQFMKVHGQRKPLAKNDIMDLMISAIVPYVDAVITENAQGELYRQAKSLKILHNLEIYSLADIWR